MRILFAGSPPVALPSLEAVAGVAGELAVMSQPDRPVGRKRVLTPTAVSSWAMENNVTLYRPVDHEGVLDAATTFAPDLGITVAYGRLLRAEVLSIPHSGWWNVHFSLLPRWRGAAPVQNALLAGDLTSGVSVFQLDEGMDTGPLLGQRAYSLPVGVTAGEVLDTLSHMGATLLTDTLHTLERGQLTVTPQEGEATHAPKLGRETGHITFTDTLDMAHRRFQATTPEPGCFVSWGEGKNVLRILSATTVSDAPTMPKGTIQETPNGVGLSLSGGVLLLETVQPAGKKAMSASDWWRGVHGEIRIDG